MTPKQLKAKIERARKRALRGPMTPKQLKAKMDRARRCKRCARSVMHCRECNKQICSHCARGLSNWSEYEDSRGGLGYPLPEGDVKLHSSCSSRKCIEAIDERYRAGLPPFFGPFGTYDGQGRP